MGGTAESQTKFPSIFIRNRVQVICAIPACAEGKILAPERASPRPTKLGGKVVRTLGSPVITFVACRQWQITPLPFSVLTSVRRLCRSCSLPPRPSWTLQVRPLSSSKLHFDIRVPRCARGDDLTIQAGLPSGMPPG